MSAKTRGRERTTRERIIAGAAELTSRSGWADVTMGGIAAHVGVSRQTVYNEFGSRAELAEAMVLTELSEFLREVDEGFDAHPDDLVAAMVEAVRRVLALAAVNPLLRAIVTATHTGETELLPLLTTRADAVISAARQAVTQRVSGYGVRVDASAEDVIDAVVRVVLSHVMQPGSTTIDTAIIVLAGSLRSPRP